MKQNRTIRFAALALLTVFAAAMGAHAVANSVFRIDDYAHFAMSTQMSLAQFVRTPIDVHFAPLHRLSTALLYSWFPMRFELAVAFLVACHVASFVALDRFLQRLNPGRVNLLLVAVFAASPFLLVGLSYWTSGLHRIPFTLLSVLCLLGYLRLRDDADWRAGVASISVYLLAMGFYSKAALLPATLVALEISVWHRPSALSLRSRIVWLLTFAAGLGGYGIAYAFHPQGYTPLTPEFVELGKSLLHSIAVLAHAPFGIIVGPEQPVAVWIPLIWAALAVVSIALSRFNAWVWLAWTGIVVLHIAMIGLSPRARPLGAMTAYVYRYYVELGLPVVVGLSAVIANLPPFDFAKRVPRWLKLRWWIVVAVGAYALFAYSAAIRLMDERYAVNRLAHDYVETLTTELDAAARAQPGTRLALLEGRVPRYMWVYDVRLRLLSNFVPLFGIDASWDVPADLLHTVDESGSVHRLKVDPLHSIRFDDVSDGRHRRSRVTLDERGCIAATGDQSGTLDLMLPRLTTVYRALVQVDSDVENPVTIRIGTWDGRAQADAAHELELKPGMGAGLVDLRPNARLGSFRVQAIRIGFPPASASVCIRSVEMTPYDLVAVAAD